MRSELTSKIASADPARGLEIAMSDHEWHQMADAIIAADAGPVTAGADDCVVNDLHSAPGASTLARPRRASRSVAVVAAACALFAAPVGIGLTGRSAGASAAASSVLDLAAEQATDPVAAAGQYWKITTIGGAAATRYETRAGSDVTSTWWVSDRSIDYVAVDGNRPTYSERVTGHSQRQLTGGPGWSPMPRESSVQTSNLSPNDLPGGWQTPNPAFLAELPRDVDQLRDRLYADVQGHGRSPDGEVVVYVADVLRSGIVPADLRAALLRVIKTVPDVDVTSQAVTLQGRKGLGIARTEPLDGTRQEIIVDPQSGLLIGERTVAVEGTSAVTAGTVITETSVQTEVVKDIPTATRAKAVHATCTFEADNAVICSKSGS